MRPSRERERRSVDRGRCRQRMEPRHQPIWVPTRSAHAEGATGQTARARAGQPWRGRRPLAGRDTCCAEPGRPCSGPGSMARSARCPQGARPCWTGAGSRTAAEDRGSLRTKVAPWDWRRRGREGRGPRGTWSRRPGAGHSAGFSLSQALDRVRQAPVGACASSPEAGARCGRAARRDLCGGCRVTGIPTATFCHYLYCSRRIPS